MLGMGGRMSGKSRIGELLGQKLNFKFFDIDKIIENETKMKITVEFDEKEYKTKGVQLITDAFDDEHYQLFTFKLSDGHEILMIRAIVKVQQSEIKSLANEDFSGSLEDAVIQDTRFYHEAQWHDAKIYERTKLHAKLVVPGPAIVSEMDSTCVILPDYEAAIDQVGNLIINPKK